jgi:SAM-dependent methyltransferase
MTKDDCAGPIGSFYAFYIAKPPLGMALGRLLWQSDFGPLYQSLGSLATVRAHCVLDVACGAGLALRYLAPRHTDHYLGIDSSPAMLAKAGAVARRRGFADARLQRADAASIPLPDSASDLCLLYNCLHCFHDPQAVLKESARCLRPGGRLVGTMLVRGASRRADQMMNHEAARGRSIIGPGGTADDLTRWMHDCGLTNVSVTAPDTLATFTARR